MCKTEWNESKSCNTILLIPVKPPSGVFTLNTNLMPLTTRPGFSLLRSGRLGAIPFTFVHHGCIAVCVLVHVFACVGRDEKDAE